MHSKFTLHGKVVEVCLTVEDRNLTKADTSHLLSVTQVSYWHSHMMPGSVHRGRIGLVQVSGREVPLHSSLSSV